jgi:hypothetical protein
MPRIVGYSYDAAFHCVACTQRAIDSTRIFREYPGPSTRDEHGIADDLRDCEGNPVHPVFGIDEGVEHEACDDCREPLA